MRTIQRNPNLEKLRHGSGQGCYYVWAEFWTWLKPDLSQAKGEEVTDRKRKERADADMAEMEAAQMAGNLLDASEVKAAWNGFLGRLRTNLDGLPDRAADLLEDGMIVAERAAVIRRELNTIRRDLVAEIQADAMEAQP